MAFDEKLANRVRALLNSQSIRFEEKRMMGGLCFMVDGKMCVGIDADRLMVRLDPAIYEESLRQPGCVPMDFTGKPMRGFVFVQPTGLSTKRDLKSWLDLALEFNPRAMSSKRNRPSKRKKSSANKKSLSQRKRST